MVLVDPREKQGESSRCMDREAGQREIVSLQSLRQPMAIARRVTNARNPGDDSRQPTRKLMHSLATALGYSEAQRDAGLLVEARQVSRARVLYTMLG
jgi:hypothetical protein